MKIRHEITYDAGVDDVFAMLTDPAFRQASCDAMGVLSADITVERDGAAATVVIDQVQPTAGVPAFARKITGDSTRAVQTEHWSDGVRATLTVTTPGKPAEITGTLTLVGDGATTVEAFEGEVKAKVPLIGGKLESLLADLFRAGMDKEHGAGVAWLAGERA
ncbi:MAG: DUF2505 domain-containing protein [Nocardioidaceae bacterium]